MFLFVGLSPPTCLGCSGRTNHDIHIRFVLFLLHNGAGISNFLVNLQPIVQFMLVYCASDYG